MSLKKSTAADLFGEIPVTKPDVYAWLISVPNIDPASLRAAAYVREFGVVNKITQAKREGTFEATTEKARSSARYLELVEENPNAASSGNAAGVGEWISTLRMPGPALRLKAPNRPREVIKKDQARERKAKAARKQLKMSMLCRLPQAMPPFEVMLQDIGSPSVLQLAAAFQVDTRTAKRWMTTEQPPLAVMMSIFWITRWGVASVDANAHNDAVTSALLANSRAREVASLHDQIAHVERLADFGSANDPLPTVQARPFADRQLTDRPVIQVETFPEPKADSPRRRAGGR